MSHADPPAGGPERQPQPVGFWISIGLALGAGLGVALHNLGLGIGAGIALGALVGHLQQRGAKRKSD